MVYNILHPSQQENFTAHRSIIFRILLFAIAINIIAGTIKRFKFRLNQIGFLLTHIGLLIIIGGATISSFTGKRGLLMLEENNTKNYYIIFKESPDTTSKEGRMPAFEKVLLPFSIKLKKFYIEYYYNSHIPSDYKSFVEITDTSGSFFYEIKMNKPLHYRKYEFFQSDFLLGSQQGEKNISVLSVNYDPGKNISFIGFLILGIGILNLFFLKNFWSKIEISLNKKLKTHPFVHAPNY
ncbi:MAG: cytochrome c biogenesis protein ResB [Planctomycetota bacterium]